MKSRVLTVIALLVVVGTPRAALPQSIQIPLTVKNESAVARTNDAVTSGVPLPPGTSSSTSWALFNGGTEVPVQTCYLPGIRTPWLLLDFQVSGALAGGATRAFTLESIAPTVVASPAISIADSLGEISVVTGPIRATIDSTDFNLLSAVWYDANGDGVFASDEQVLPPTSASRLVVVDARGTTYTGRGVLDSLVWEYRGSLRATLRVDGRYMAGSDTLLFFTTRMTFRAGRADVIVEHLIRNSFQYQSRFVKLKSALVRLDTLSAPARLARSGDRVWLNPASGQGSVELIPATIFLRSSDAQRTLTSLDVDSNGGLVIPDLSYHGGAICLDFTPGLSGQDQTDRATLFADRLVALAPDTTYSNDGAFGADHFETLADEESTYTHWGWSWPTTSDSRSYPPAVPRTSSSYDPNWSQILVGADLEADDVDMHLIMYARTGLRSFLDRADAWARYMSWEFAYRTDGFAYAWNDWQEYAGAPGYLPVQRTVQWLPDISSYTPNDILYDSLNVKEGKDESLHTWNGGLVDYYYLTGDKDALAAAADIAERSRRYSQWRVPGTVPNGSANGDARFHARSYLNFLRVWEATGGSDWLACANLVREMFVRSARYDVRGFFYSNTSELGLDLDSVSYSSRYPNGKYFSPFIMGAVVQALNHGELVQPNDTVQAVLSQIAGFALAHGVDSNGFTGDNIVVDSDSTGSVRHLSNDVFRNKQPTSSQITFSFASSSEQFIDALAIGYRQTGNCAYMSAAKEMWNAASKGPPGYRFASDTQVGHWVNGLEGFYPPEQLLYPDNGDLTTAEAFFHDAARMTVLSTPAAVSNLAASPGKTTAVASWTAPGADGGTARADAYDLRWSPFTITAGNFSSANQAATGPPGDPGTAECVEIDQLSSCMPYWFAIKSHTACGWSDISNIVHITTRCSGFVEVSCGGFGAHRPVDDDPAVPKELAFSVEGPRPSGGSVGIRLGIPVILGAARLRLAVFDIAGRRVRLLADGRSAPGWRELIWDTSQDGGGQVRAGVYFLRLSIGSEEREERIVLIR